MLEEKVSLKSPEVRRWDLIEKLFDHKLNDNFTELDMDEIRAFSFYYAVHMHITPLSSVMAVLEKWASLKRSYERKGRQEVVTILKQPPRYYIKELEFEGEEAPKKTLKEGLLRMFRRK